MNTLGHAPIVIRTNYGILYPQTISAVILGSVYIWTKLYPVRPDACSQVLDIPVGVRAIDKDSKHLLYPFRRRNMGFMAALVRKLSVLFRPRDSHYASETTEMSI